MTENEWKLLMAMISEIKDDVKEVKKDVGSLKLKVYGVAAVISSFIGAIFK
jgi:hypothetical protein